MPKHWNHKKHSFSQNKLTKKEEFQWVLTVVVFVTFFIIYFTNNFFSNCIFEWPIRWNVKVCWNEQIPDAKERALEKAANFIP